MIEGARIVVPGSAAGPVVHLDEPLSFWGGFSAERGVVIDGHHPQAGVSLAHAVVVMEGGRGSSSASSVLVEAIRLGNAPAAILMRRADEILVTGALAARELYDRTVPIAILDDGMFAQAAAAAHAELTTDGRLTFR